MGFERLKEREKGGEKEPEERIVISSIYKAFKNRATKKQWVWKGWDQKLSDFRILEMISEYRRWTSNAGPIEVNCEVPQLT